MRVLKIICILLAILAILFTIGLFMIKDSIHDEAQSLKDGKGTTLKIDKVNEGGKIYYKVGESKYTEEEYTDAITMIDDSMGTITIIGCGISVLFIAGAVGCGVAQKKKSN